MRRWLTHSPTLQAIGFMVLMILASVLCNYLATGVVWVLQ